MKYLVIIGFSLVVATQGFSIALAHEESSPWPVNLNSLTDSGIGAHFQDSTDGDSPSWTVPIPQRINSRSENHGSGSIQLQEVNTVYWGDTAFSQGFPYSSFSISFSSPVDVFYVESCFEIINSSNGERVIPRRITVELPGNRAATTSRFFRFHLQPTSSRSLALGQGGHFIARVYGSNFLNDGSFDPCSYFSNASVNVQIHSDYQMVESR